jgi:opacity protein-like surface antigen
MKKLLALVLAIALLAMPAAQAVSVKGSQGQQLTVSATTAKNGSMITVRGNRFDETVGIYLAFCVVPKKGELPTPCGGGVNKAGTGESSFWISSNPPPYAVGLTDEFLPGGRFTHKVKISKKIGKFDCTKVKCAITVRADHLRGNDRSYDMFVPVKIK